MLKYNLKRIWEVFDDTGYVKFNNGSFIFVFSYYKNDQTLDFFMFDVRDKKMNNPFVHHSVPFVSVYNYDDFEAFCSDCYDRVVEYTDYINSKADFLIRS